VKRTRIRKQSELLDQIFFKLINTINAQPSSHLWIARENEINAVKRIIVNTGPGEAPPPPKELVVGVPKTASMTASVRGGGYPRGV